ncbi:MAG: carbonic anhydrase, partial [Phycisphaerales bacterium]
FVTVLTCADSRLPVERIFDRGVGDVFVVRVAGNVAGDSETGTIEYGVEHLNTPLLVVMGHTKCGAVAAAASGAQLHGKLAGLIDHIGPAVERARKNNPAADDAQIAQLAITENVWQTVYDLYKSSPEVLEKVENGELKVVGALCDISTGKVEWLGEHPWQSELLTALKAAPADAGPERATTQADDKDH